MWSSYDDVFIEFIDTVLYHDIYFYLGMKWPIGTEDFLHITQPQFVSVSPLAVLANSDSVREGVECQTEQV